jgi:hypothetical protein
MFNAWKSINKTAKAKKGEQTPTSSVTCLDEGPSSDIVIERRLSRSEDDSLIDIELRDRIRVKVGVPLFAAADDSLLAGGVTKVGTDVDGETAVAAVLAVDDVVVVTAAPSSTWR